MTEQNMPLQYLTARLSSSWNIQKQYETRE